LRFRCACPVTRPGTTRLFTPAGIFQRGRRPARHDCAIVFSVRSLPHGPQCACFPPPSKHPWVYEDLNIALCLATHQNLENAKATWTATTRFWPAML
jgi:hypothetical protein